MSAWNAIVDKIFYGNAGIAKGKPNVIISDDAAPTSTAPLGTLAWDPTNEYVYINQDGSTTWYRIPVNAA